ncbi:7625_t:CDS:2 [Gigaspora margarita]|uniref:7625_t:CDS:1 n=1 Tax=Gigaspora margarita TaxID=4874 RepID=A0ABN7UU49_GIGMA|nr:7625_t:CDS:2 [Gigaspora margarita]
MESFSFSEQLNTYLKDKNDIKIFDLLKHEINPKCIGRGGFAIVYSVTIEEKNYALKSFKQNAVLYKDEFKEFMREIYRRIENIIIEENQTTKNTFDCLRNKENNNNSDWLCLLGFFHLEGIGTEKNQKVAHSTFQKAKNGNTKGNFMAKFYLGECLRNGYGAKRNLESAKLLYEDIESECARAANSLGLCYLKGIRYRTKKKAIEWFEKSYKKGCISACQG